MSAHTYTADMLVGDIVKTDPATIQILEGAGMGCVGCPASQSESLADACMVHGLDADAVLRLLNREA